MVRDQPFDSLIKESLAQGNPPAADWVGFVNALRSL